MHGRRDLIIIYEMVYVACGERMVEARGGITSYAIHWISWISHYVKNFISDKKLSISSGFSGQTRVFLGEAWRINFYPNAVELEKKCREVPRSTSKLMGRTWEQPTRRPSIPTIATVQNSRAACNNVHVRLCPNISLFKRSQMVGKLPVC